MDNKLILEFSDTVSMEMTDLGINLKQEDRMISLPEKDIIPFTQAVISLYQSVLERQVKNES